MEISSEVLRIKNFVSELLVTIMLPFYTILFSCRASIKRREILQENVFLVEYKLVRNYVVSRVCDIRHVVG